ncbi:MAG TPA: hypothetical protein VIX89_09045 [Bryobacteraceae bacterium]
MKVEIARTDTSHKPLVDRVAASRYINKSARLRDLLLYLCQRACERPADEIHEQEIGHKVFGRPQGYDTGSDNIVRVHVSMLRKRLEQYFDTEGADEPVILEIPRGNYTPVFQERPPFPHETTVPEPAARPTWDWRIPALAIIAVIFAVSTAVLLFRNTPLKVPAGPQGPTVRAFWSQVFNSSQITDVVLDDAAVALYQELAGRNLALSEYFDRSYLRKMPDGAEAAKLDEATASAIVLHRYSNYSSASFLWKLAQLAGANASRTNVVLARDHSFHALKSHNAVLLGNQRSNPWFEPFLTHVGLRWQWDKAAGVYYPVDTWSGTEPKVYRNVDAADTHEGYCAIALLPNLGGSGNVLIVSATGGSAMNAATGFLTDEAAMSKLRKSFPATKDNQFPPFESLVRLKGRSSLPQDATVVVSRLVR